MNLHLLRSKKLTRYFKEKKINLWFFFYTINSQYSSFFFFFFFIKSPLTETGKHSYDLGENDSKKMITIKKGVIKKKVGKKKNLINLLFFINMKKKANDDLGENVSVFFERLLVKFSSFIFFHFLISILE